MSDSVGVIAGMHSFLCAFVCVYCSSKPRVCVLADSDEESSSAGSSDEEDLPPAEPQGSPGDKGAATVGADGYKCYAKMSH